MSATIDGEVTADERAAAYEHALRCATCRDGLNFSRALMDPVVAIPAPIDDTRLTARERRWFGGQWTRWLLMLAAVAIVAASIPQYIVGDGLSPDSHAAGHLASWQIGFGVGLFVAAWVSRMSHAMLALAVTFAVLTIAARVVEVIQGEHGPWIDAVHLMELVGVFLLWRLAPSHLLPFRGRREESVSEPRQQVGPSGVPDRRAGES